MKKQMLFVLTVLIILIILTVLPSFAAPFPDVPSSEWYAPYVEELFEDGIIQGYPNGKFGSWDPVNRAELSKIIVNLKRLLQQEVLPWWEQHAFELMLFVITLLGWISVIKLSRKPINISHICKTDAGQSVRSEGGNEAGFEVKHSSHRSPPTNWWM